MLVKDCMTKDLITISAREDVQYGFYLLKKHDVKQLPVIDNGNLLGIITERDLRMVIEKEYGIKIESTMSKNLQTITENDAIETAAKIIHDNKYNALPVVDKGGQLVGIVTVTDVIEGLLNIIKNEKHVKVKPQIPDKNFD